MVHTRSHSDKISYFHLLNTDTNTIVFQNKTFPNSWWSEIAGIENDTIILKEFVSDQSAPQIKKYLLLQLSDFSLIAEKPDFYLPESSFSIIFPMVFDNENPHSATITEFLNGINITGSLPFYEYHEDNNLIIISYYLSKNTSMDNFLLILNRDGEVLFNEAIQTGAIGMGVDTYFLYNNNVYFIQDKKTLKVYTIY